MKSKLLATLGLVAMITASNVVGVFASELVEHDSANSSATVSFTDGGGTVTPPVDPEEPDENVDPDDEDEDDGGQTGHDGALRIDYVPAFKFGERELVSGEKLYNANLISVNNGTHQVPNFVQVSDLRGTGEGWELSVKQMSDFAVEGQESKILDGAEIIISNIKTNTAHEGQEVNVASNSITLSESAGDQKLLIADEDKGMGTHVAYFGNLNAGDDESAKESVQLKIPANVTPYAEEYKTTLTWTLSSVPGEDA